MTAVAPDYTVDGLVTKVRNSYVTPNSQALFQDTDIVSFLDDQIESDIVPSIMAARSEYWVKNYDTQVSGAASYTIQTRSSGAMLRDVVFVDPQGNEIELQYLSPVQIKATFPFGYQMPLSMFGYYIENDQIILYPQQATNATAYQLRQKIYRRPNTLTLTSNCGRITNIASSVITVDNLVSTWTTSDTFDIIQDFPQFTSISDGQTITNINSATNEITLSSVPTSLAVGMYLCPTLMSCVPQIPLAAFSMLTYAAISDMAQSLGDSQGTQLAQKKYETQRVNLLKMIAPRVQGGTMKIVNRNSPSTWGMMGSPFLR